MGKYILGVDNGGTYIKAVLFDVKGNQIALEKQQNHVIHMAGGRAEFDEEALWKTNCDCMRKVIKKAGIKKEDICCIGFSGQGKGLYMVDDEGNPFRNAITSSDLRADSYCKKWEQDGAARKVFHKILQRPVAGQTVSILRWMKEHEPENYKKIRWVFSMKDYLLFRLTGIPAAGKGSQSGTCLVNLLTQDYDPQLLEEFEISEIENKLPPLVWDTQICGYVTREAALECGCQEGTPVAAGMFDVDAAAVAMGVTDEKSVFMIVGTCGINGYISKEPVTNGTVMFNSLYSLKGTYLIEDSSAASAGILEWVNRAFFADKQGRELYDEINEMVEDTEPEHSKLIFLPSLYGFKHGGDEGSFQSRGAWIGLCPEHTRKEMLRAVYEGIVFVHKVHLEHLLENRDRPSLIKIAGGVTNSKVWVQMFSDILQMPMEVIENSEMGAKGVAIASAAAIGIYSDMDEAISEMTSAGQIVYPRKKYEDIYTEKYNRFKMVMEAMERIWPLFGEAE